MSSHISPMGLSALMSCLTGPSTLASCPLPPLDSLHGSLCPHIWPLYVVLSAADTWPLVTGQPGMSHNASFCGWASWVTTLLEQRCPQSMVSSPPLHCAVPFPSQSELDGVSGVLGTTESKTIKLTKDLATVESHLQDTQVPHGGSQASLCSTVCPLDCGCGQEGLNAGEVQQDAIGTGCRGVRSGGVYYVGWERGRASDPGVMEEIFDLWVGAGAGSLNQVASGHWL